MLRRCLICDMAIHKATENTVPNASLDHEIEDAPIDAVCLRTVVPHHSKVLRQDVVYEITICDICLLKHSDVTYKIQNDKCVGRLSDDTV